MSNKTRHSDNHVVGSPDWRYERFAELRANFPDFDHDQIWEAMHDEMVSEQEAAEGRRIAAEMDA